MKTYKYFIVALCAIIACSCLDGHHKKRLGDNDKFSHHEDMHEEIEMLDAEVTTVTKGEVIYEGNSNIEWVITAEETTTEGLFIITFDGTIKSGHHGYGMADFSAPYFEFDNAEIVGDIIEPITPVEQPDEFGGTSYIYYDSATYIQPIKSTQGQQVTGYINATTCTNESNQCTCNLATFTIQMPGKAAKVEEASKKTTMKVGGDAGSPNVEWTITAEEEGDGIFVVTFDGAIKEGYHGYAMKDMFSAPMFEFEGTEVVGDVVEPLTSWEHPDEWGTSYIYYHQAIYQYKIKASAGENVPCYISATICTNEGNQCTANIAEFNITMPGKLKHQETQADTKGIKYADFLHLPHQLEGHFDFEEAVEDAMAQNKPIFVYITGHACINCREMEIVVWSNDRVLPMLREDFVICALYVDDMTKFDGGERLGSKNIKLAQERWGVNAQPAYIILSPDGDTVLAGPRGYNTDIDAFVEFLNKGKAGVK